MRLLFGMLLGAVLTAGAAYLHDSRVVHRTATGETAPFEQQTMVNWDVVEQNWQAVKSRASQEWARLSSNRQ